MTKRGKKVTDERWNPWKAGGDKEMGYICRWVELQFHIKHGYKNKQEAAKAARQKNKALLLAKRLKAFKVRK